MAQVFPISVSSRVNVSTASAAQTEFSINFPWQADADITVIKVAVDGTRTTLVNPTHYTLTGAGEEAGGSLTLVTPATAGEQYIRIGTALLQRLSSIVSAGRYKANPIDADFDRGLLIAQEQQRDIDRSWKSDYGSAGGSITAGTEGQVLAFDADGNLVPMDIGDLL